MYVDDDRFRAESARLEANRLRSMPEYQLWLRRGWLVMMRGRYQISLARKPRGCAARLRPCFERPPKLAHSNAIENTRVADVELLEVGKNENVFARVVFMAVEIEEEGIFRHIVTYL